MICAGYFKVIGYEIKYIVICIRIEVSGPLTSHYSESVDKI